MKQIKDIQNKLKWEEFYNSDFDWNNDKLYRSNQLSEDFIREFKDKVNWKLISMSQKLSEDFIREFQDKVDWYWISSLQKLSEEFIREFQDKVDWYIVSIEQNFSLEFAGDFYKVLSLYNILYRNKNFSFKQTEEIRRLFEKLVSDKPKSETD